METIAQVAEALRVVLTEEADRAARETGFVRRRSKLTGAAFVQTLVLGWLHNPQASLSELTQWAARVGRVISPQGLDQRFGEAAAHGLAQVLDAAATQVVSADPATVPLLERFTAVVVQDSTTIALPDALAAAWPGCGGRVPQGSAAALKVQVRWDLRGGGLTGAERQAGRAHDQSGDLAPAPLPAGALYLADLGYFSLPRLAERSARGEYWLTRWKAGVAVQTPAGTPCVTPAWLQRQGVVVDQAVVVGVEQQLPARLLAVRVPPAVAQARRRKLRAEAQREGKTPSAARLALADWTLLLTNVPGAQLSVAEALVLARVRWPIELLFKRWKPHGRIDEWRSAKPWHVLCTVYAKLLAMVVQHWCCLVGCWDAPDRSWVKAAQAVRGDVTRLACACRRAVSFRWALQQLQRAQQGTCRQNPRRQRPNTYQLLLRGPDRTAALAVAAPPAAA